jgi:23S rRNA (cytosine1962-C5)-methyltransferase
MLDLTLIRTALLSRPLDINSDHRSAMRMFNGFLEGYPEMAIDRFADTFVVYNHSSEPGLLLPEISTLQSLLMEMFPWTRCIVLKERYSSKVESRNGQIIFGSHTADWIEENRIKYALDLTLNQDASFYFDTRNLRTWLITHAMGWKVLNTFAYTGSLGIAALAGGASQVVQTDRNHRFLQLAEKSCERNEFQKEKHKIVVGDFFKITGQFRHKKEVFDCVIVDPPYFSTSSKGTIDLQAQSKRVLNKVRPLIGNNGYLIAINNSLYLSGKDYLTSLKELTSDGFVSIEEIIPVPEDATGYPRTILSSPPVDPSPFNHSTKIVILQVKKK